MKQVRPYPSEMAEIPLEDQGPIRGRSFFPGGDGLALGSSAAFPDRPIIILGNDFDSLEGYQTSARRLEEPVQGTWSGLLNMLRIADVPVSECFFTNAFMGARRSGVNTGRSPWLLSHNKTSVPRCVEYLRTQIEVVRPRSVIMIGKEQAMLVGMAFPELQALGRKLGWTWPQIDASGLQYRSGVSHPTSTSTPPFAFCAVMHPCMRASNLKQTGRMFAHPLHGTHHGEDAEILMMKLCRDA
jgi:uracil-DNA glycosylase